MLGWVERGEMWILWGESEAEREWGSDMVGWGCGELQHQHEVYLGGGGKEARIKVDQGNYMQEMTSEQSGLNWFFSLHIFTWSSMWKNNSNNFFFNWIIVLNSTQLFVLNAYSAVVSSICKHSILNSNSSSQLLDAIQATRCKVINKPPTVNSF